MHSFEVLGSFTDSALSYGDVDVSLYLLSRDFNQQAKEGPLTASNSTRMVAAESSTVSVAEEIFVCSKLTTPDSLRLLNVQLGTVDDIVQIKLCEATEAVLYRFLSCLWGDQIEKFPCSKAKQQS